MNEILRDRLAWLHHLIGRDVLAPAEGAGDFSHIVSDLLLEYGMMTSPNCNGRHRPRRMETILKNLTAMRNASRRHMEGDEGNFITLVQTHNKVLKCYRHQQITREMCKHEQEEFRKNPWQYAHKKLQLSNNPDPSFDHGAATNYFKETNSDSTVTCQHITRLDP